MLHADLAQAPYVSWRHPNRNLEVSIDSLALHALPARTLRFSQRHPSSEIGGLLWGKVQSDGDYRSVVLSQVEFLPSEGHLFNVTPADFSHLASATRRFRGDWEPLAYFRSNLRDDPCLSPQDVEFVHQVVADSDSLVLILSPAGESACTADLYFWESDNLRLYSELLELPLSPSEADGRPQSPFSGIWNEDVQASGSRLRLGNHQHSSAVLESGMTFRPPDHWPSQPLFVSSRTSLRKGLSKAAPFFLAVCVTVGLVTTWKLRRVKVPVDAVSPQLALGVTRRTDGQFELRWNRKLLPSSPAPNGTLSTIEGLSSDGDRFQLQMIIDQRTPAAAHRPDLTNRSSMHGVTSSDAAKIEEEALLSRSPLIRRPLPGAPERTPGGQKASGSNGNRHPANIGNRRRGRAAAITKSSGLRSLETVPLLRASETHMRQLLPAMMPAANGEELRSLPQSELPQKEPSAPGSVEKTGTAKSSSPLKSAEERMDKAPAQQTGPAQAGEGSTVAANVPPRPLKQLLPKLKRSEFSDDQKIVDIDIQVTVDGDGNVTEAHPMRNSTGPKSLLSERAVATAKRWKFKPAQYLGKNVSGTYVINFQFQRPN